MLGDVLESLAGAIFIDSGCSLESVWSIFHSMFEERIGKSNLPVCTNIIASTIMIVSVSHCGWDVCVPTASFKGAVPIPPQEELLEVAPGAKVKPDK